jgi:hypothetical protein
MALSVFVASHDELERWQTAVFQVGCSPRWKTAPPMIRAASEYLWLPMIASASETRHRLQLHDRALDPQPHSPALHVAAVEHQVEQATGLDDGIAPALLD